VDTEECAELTVLAVSECFSELTRLGVFDWLEELLLRKDSFLDRFDLYAQSNREFDRDREPSS
jgi:hypothetical protein